MAGDRRAEKIAFLPGSFNPRPHVAGDALALGALLSRLQVSIHARTWRATSALSAPSRMMQCFNPRPHVAGDCQFRSAKAHPCGFQSTPARGGRPELLEFVATHTEFQSTPARGGRPEGSVWKAANACFNPRPHVAGDRIRAPASPSRRRFQSTPARGGRRVRLARGGSPSLRFNPRPHVAGDTAFGAVLSRLQVSIHARTWRATHPMQLQTPKEVARHDPRTSRIGG